MNFVFRTDSSSEIGTGHMMRCIALAQKMQDCGHQVFFLMINPDPYARKRLGAEGLKLISMESCELRRDADIAVETAKSVGAQWIVIDGYKFDGKYQSVLKDSGTSVLFVDDNGHCTDYCADFILNQNVYASKSFYKNRQADTRLLLGPEYALIRREFLVFSKKERIFPEKAKRLLVTLGGADPCNMTGTVMDALIEMNDKSLETKILIGGSNPHKDSLFSKAAGMNLEFLVNAPNMPELMDWADAAVTAAGSTTLETSYMRLPSLMIILADNQLRVAAKMKDLGAGINLGWFSEITIDKLKNELGKFIVSRAARQSVSEACGNLVDGFGTQRILDLMLKQG